ncbi:MAG: hypothetical protein EBY20_00025 [Alphaproteobacteria bacterium]|jgi:hypothetical protein|uniref:J domain-containing protein n=1 Tax=viral metagenome TaxID=1070528 RepID=A0A6C0HQN0_9ZZZZ|nr:hypothetical protein [Alphaproteobacteria bacterium]
MNSVDLDINNYNLQDILSLFKVPVNFDEHDMKRAKQIVLKTHPDKSNLPADYFLFYSKAYKMLYSVWEFKKRGDVDSKNPKNTEYSTYSDEDKTVLLDQFFESNEKFKKSANFNRWFNEQFERNKLSNEHEEKGYGDWLKTDEDIEQAKNVSMATMKQEFDKKKEKARSLIVREDVQEIWSTNSITSSELSNDAPGTYDSGLFSGLGFQDLYKAHTETVIPVTEEDYEQKQKFGSVNEYMSYRNNQDTKPLSEQQAEQYLKQRNEKEEERAIRRAYELAKQTEMAKQKNQEFWSGLQLLKNN